MVESLRIWNANHENLPPWGLKLRCGGPEAAAIPDSRVLSAHIASCWRSKTPFKATAGLHHPVRRYDQELGAKTFGFFNVFVGAILCGAQELGEPHLYTLVEDESSKSFAFEDDEMVWRHLHADAEQVRHWRTVLATSFGSCSFDEPRGALLSMGFLEKI
jgi:hypothetical protein